LHQRQLQLIAVPLYQGKPLYQSYLIKSSRPELEVRGWPDVRGKVMAYSDPLSNSGWLVAQTQLHAVGLSQRDLKKTFFAHGHRNVAEAVAAQLADVGPIDGYVWETMKAQRMPAVDQTEIVWKSEVFGFPPIVAPASARNPRIQSLQASLLEMHKDPDGRRLLDALNLTGFEAGSPSLFDSIARMSAALQARTR
jgi:phosphonate transport system substrate-binding protein